MDKYPFTNDRPIYQQLAEKARYANLTPQEQELYDYDLRNYLAYVDSMMYAKDMAKAEGIAIGEAKGEAKGKAEGKVMLLKAQIKDGLITIEKAAEYAEMPVDEFKRLIEE